MGEHLCGKGKMWPLNTIAFWMPCVRVYLLLYWVRMFDPGFEIGISFNMPEKQVLDYIIGRSLIHSNPQCLISPHLVWNLMCFFLCLLQILYRCQPNWPTPQQPNAYYHGPRKQDLLARRLQTGNNSLIFCLCAAWNLHLDKLSLCLRLHLPVFYV